MRDYPLQIFGDIEEFSLYAASDYADSLGDGDEGIIEICSHGGFVFFGNAAAQKIAEAQARGARFTARIFGVAASSAADIALACDRVEMAQNAAIMIHSAWNPGGKTDAGIAAANAAQLAVIRRRIPDYTENDLKKDRWFTATQAMEIGLCDSIIADITTRTAIGAACARYAAKYTPTKGETEMDEEKKVEEVKEIDEKKDDVRSEEPSVEDVLERIAERLDDLEARLVALESARAACGSDDERRPEGRLAALYRRMNEARTAAQAAQAVSGPCVRKATLAGKAADPKAELDAFNAKYPDIKRLVKEV